MDKRQLRQSAMTDFMQSLEQLDELWGDGSDQAWDESSMVSEPDKTERPNQKSSGEAATRTTESR